MNSYPGFLHQHVRERGENHSREVCSAVQLALTRASVRHLPCQRSFSILVGKWSKTFSARPDPHQINQLTNYKLFPLFQKTNSLSLMGFMLNSF